MNDALQKLLLELRRAKNYFAVSFEDYVPACYFKSRSNPIRDIANLLAGAFSVPGAPRYIRRRISGARRSIPPPRPT